MSNWLQTLVKCLRQKSNNIPPTDEITFPLTEGGKKTIIKGAREISKIKSNSPPGAGTHQEQKISVKMSKNENKYIDLYLPKVEHTPPMPPCKPPKPDNEEDVSIHTFTKIPICVNGKDDKFCDMNCPHLRDLEYGLCSVFGKLIFENGEFRRNVMCRMGQIGIK